jgi:hypothetical protein
VARFGDAMGEQKAPATVWRYVSSVSTFHRADGVANPVEAMAVKLALKRLHRAKGRAQAQAAPLNRPELVWGFRCQADFGGASLVSAKATRWLDRLDVGEVKIADRLQDSGQRAVLQVFRQRFEPCGVLCLQIHQFSDGVTPAPDTAATVVRSAGADD